MTFLTLFVRQPHQTSDMLTNFKMIFFCIFENVDDLASKCKNNYGAAAKIGKVMKDYVQKGKKVKTEKMSFVSVFEHTIIGGVFF